MSRCRCSDGLFIERVELDRLIRESKARVLRRQVDLYGYNFCEDCSRSGGVILDCSHDISVSDCIGGGFSEISYSDNNIRIRCRGCHEVYDKLKIGGCNVK